MQRVLHLRWEHIDATDDEHIVHPTGYSGYARVRPAACADLVVHDGQVTDAIAYDGGRLPSAAWSAPSRPRSPGPTGSSVFGSMISSRHDVSPEVDALLMLAFVTTSVRSISLAPKQLMPLTPSESWMLVAHLVRPRLGPEQPRPQLRVILEADAHLVRDLTHMDHVRRRACHGGDAKVLDELHLPFGVAGAGRYDRRADALCPIVEPQPAGEQTVGVGHLHHVVRSRPRSSSRGPVTRTSYQCHCGCSPQWSVCRWFPTRRGTVRCPGGRDEQAYLDSYLESPSWT